MAVAVVTGASSGIGLELAREFAEHDFDVVLVAEEPEVHAAAAEIGGRALQLDLTDPAAVEELVAQVGQPDAVAINAGIGASGAFVHATTLQEHLDTVDLNVRSAVHLAKRVLPGMVDRGSGRVSSPRRSRRSPRGRTRRCTTRRRRSCGRSRRRCGRS